MLVRQEPDATAAVDDDHRPVAADNPTVYVPVPLRDHLAIASGEAEHRHVTMAFLKFSGPDDVVEREGPDAAARTARRARRCRRRRSRPRTGITWLESDIDINAGKLYLTAGAPSLSGRDEEGMLRALRDVLDAGLPLQLRAGVNRGPVFTGDIGAESRRTYAVMGDAVNLAARLTGRAQPGTILTTADVLERATTRFETEKQPFLVKGKERAVTAYTVGLPVGVREERAGAPLPIVGREAELEHPALGRQRRADAPEQRVVELVGEPGIGKSRLVQELATLRSGSRHSPPPASNTRHRLPSTRGATSCARWPGSRPRCRARRPAGCSSRGSQA